MAGSKTGVVMVEGGCDFVSEEELLDAIFFGHESIQPIIELQEKLKESSGKPKREHITVEDDPELVALVEQKAASRIREKIVIVDKVERNTALGVLKKEIAEELGEDYAERKDEVSAVFKTLHKKLCRDLVLKEGLRIDGRKFDEVRPIACQTGLLPRNPRLRLVHQGRNPGPGRGHLGLRTRRAKGGDPERGRNQTLYAALQLSAVLGGRSQEDFRP